MTLQVKQENAGTPYAATLLPGKPLNVRFNWENPPLTPDASNEEWEAWFKKQREETLGITSYSSVYTFLYIDDFEVRHEILIPLLTLEKSIPLERDDDEFLDIEEQDAMRDQIEAFFCSGNPLEIDGELVSATVQRCDFYGLDFKDFARQAPRKRVPMASARLGIILGYRCTEPPSHVKLTWDRFNNALWSVNTVVFAGDQTTKTALSRLGKKNVFEWQSPPRAPIEPIQPVPANIPPDPTR